MKTKIVFVVLLIFFSFDLYSQKTTRINENQKKPIEIILKRHYKFPRMAFKYRTGMEQTFFRKDSVNLDNTVFIHVDYSDSLKNIRYGMKVLLIDLKSTNYKEYSEFWYLNYEKEGLHPANGGMTNNGFGWHKNINKSKTDKAIHEIINVIK